VHCLDCTALDAQPDIVLQYNALGSLSPPPVCCLILQAPAGQPPDVPARLLQACDMAAAAAAAAAAVGKRGGRRMRLRKARKLRTQQPTFKCTAGQTIWVAPYERYDAHIV